MKLFLATLQFMSRLPIPGRWTKDVPFERYVDGVVWFPWVGLILGGIATVIFQWIWMASQDPYLAAAAYVLVMALLTGAFHLDGLADTADGVFSARTRERMLEIMHDSRLGTNGGLALIFLILFEVLIIGHLTLAHPQQVFRMLWAAPIAGRALMVVLMYRQPYAREQGLAHGFIGQISRKQTVITLLGGAFLLLCLLGWHGLFGYVVTLLFAWCFQRWIHHRLGGQTGDTLGCGNQLFEFCFLLTCL